MKALFATWDVERIAGRDAAYDEVLSRVWRICVDCEDGSSRWNYVRRGALPELEDWLEHNHFLGLEAVPPTDEELADLRTSISAPPS